MPHFSLSNHTFSMRIILIVCILFIFTSLSGRVSAATFTVDITADENDSSCIVGDCSLREAIIAANAVPDSVVIIPAGTYELSITGGGEDFAATGDLDIRARMTIQGAGAASTIIDGGQIDRVFHVVIGVLVNMSDLTIQNGKLVNFPDGGGGIYARGQLNLSNCVITNNRAENGQGGGLWTYPLYITNISHCIISNNFSLGAGSGIRSHSKMSITNSTISGNSTGIVPVEVQHGGGGIFHSFETLTITDSTVTGNSSQVGGGIRNETGMLNITRSVISNNTQGGIYSSGGNDTITDTTFSNNTSSGDGGAMWYVGTLTMRDSTFSNNISATRGGAIYNLGILNVANTTFSGNSASLGGAFFVDEFTVNPEIETNVSVANSTFYGNSATVNGGDLYLADDNGDVTLFANIFANTTGGQCFINGNGAIISNAFNLSDDNTCSAYLTHTMDRNNTDPLLGPLQTNGGFTSTHALSYTSPALNFVPTNLCTVVTDQRGVTRPQGYACDIGAYEYEDNILQTGTVLTVNVNSDSNGLCTAFHCSLREAISAANASPDTNTIVFNITGMNVHTIQPESPLPTITNPVIIDGTTQPGYAVSAPKIELDGTNAGDPADGLLITAGNSTVKGLIINRFTAAGIALQTNGNNVIAGNYIGTDYNAGLTIFIGNQDGIHILNSSNNIIGGTTVATRNIISDNNRNGLFLEGAGSTGNSITGNYIGTDSSGIIHLRNFADGIKITDAPGNTIGGTAVGSGNLISGNQSDGIDISGNSSGTIIQGNFIGVGTGVNSTVMIPNEGYGINITSVPNNTIGGLTSAARNVISGNGSSGVRIRGSASTNNLIQGNYIGTDVTGTMDKGNYGAGVVIEFGLNNIIGGTVPGARNLVSGNGSGISLTGSNNIVQGNYVGTDVTGMIAIPNSQGIFVGPGTATNNVIGGISPEAGNLISGNGSGVQLSIMANANLIQGNIIGADVTGTQPLGNTSFGVRVNHGTNNIIGGESPNTGNIIAFNSTDGVQSLEQIAGDSSTRIVGNSIFSNSGLGIDLTDDGLTPNDPNDTDTGANLRQNFPVLINGGPFGGGTTINGTLNSQPNKTYRLEFFANAACDSSGYGEGQTYLGFTNVTTNGNGDVIFSANLSAVTSNGQFITATATDPDNNTSEFSACVPVEIISPPVAAPSRNYFTTASVPLSWQGVTWALGYEIEVDTDDDFADPYAYSNRSLSASTQSDSTTPLSDGLYYWRVGAKKAGGGIVWSAVQSFTVDVP